MLVLKIRYVSKIFTRSCIKMDSWDKSGQSEFYELPTCWLLFKFPYKNQTYGIFFISNQTHGMLHAKNPKTY